MAGGERLLPQELAHLQIEDLTDRAVTFEYRFTNGAMIFARKGDHVKDKLTQKQLAEQAQVSPRVINLIETCRLYPSLEIAQRIADVLKVKPSVLFPPGLKEFTRPSSQPAKLRNLLTSLEVDKFRRLIEAQLNESDYFTELYERHHVPIPPSLPQVMDKPEILVEQARQLFNFNAKREWVLDRLGVAKNRVVFMYDLRKRTSKEKQAKETDKNDPELNRLRLICALEDEVKQTPKRRKPNYESFVST